MMKNLLYVGNKLSEHGSTATAIEVLGPLLESEGFQVAYTSSEKNKLLRLADMLWQTIRRRKTTDYVLIDTYSSWNFWYVFAISQLCRLFNLKYIPILHGGNLPRRLKRNPGLCRIIFGHALVNVAPSGYLYDAFSTAGFNVVKIPNPFNATAFPYKQRDSLQPKLLWVRSFAALYNPEMALRVFKLVQNRFPEARLCMVGPDKDGMLDKIKQTVANNPNIVFTGRLTKPEWALLAADYDIFINTAKTDNAPFSVIEALSLGMAVVSTNVGGIPYLLTDQESALLVASNDAAAMADAVISLVENDALAKYILGQSHDLARQFDWVNVREKWLEILN